MVKVQIARRLSGHGDFTLLSEVGTAIMNWRIGVGMGVLKWFILEMTRMTKAFAWDGTTSAN
jgi:hypothetical protein